MPTNVRNQVVVSVSAALMLLQKTHIPSFQNNILLLVTVWHQKRYFVSSVDYHCLQKHVCFPKVINV